LEQYISIDNHYVLYLLLCSEEYEDVDYHIPINY